MLDRPLQFCFGPALGRQPAVLHQAPHDFDAVELRAVGRQDRELAALLVQHPECRPNGRRAVNLGIVEHDDQRLADLLGQIVHESQKELGRTAAPVVGIFDSCAAQQRRHDVEALAARGIDAVLLASWCPGTAVGVDLRETGLVEVGQFDLACLRLGSQFVEFFAGLGEGGGVSLFFKLWRVRFHTRPLALRIRVRVSTWIGSPCAWTWRCSSWVALKGSSRAHCSRRSTAAWSSLLGAPLRGLSCRHAMPSLSQRCQVSRTVQILRSCTLATSRLSMGWDSSSKVLARSRARQSGDFRTTCSSASRSSSLSRVSSRLPIRIPRLHDTAHAAEDRIRPHGQPVLTHGVENFHGLTYRNSLCQKKYQVRLGNSWMLLSGLVERLMHSHVSSDMMRRPGAGRWCGRTGD